MPSSKPKNGVININTELLDKNQRKSTDSSGSASFTPSKTLYDEMKVILLIFIKIALSNIAELFPQTLANMFIGHLNNASYLLSACGLARTFCNVMGLAQAWSFSSALYILIPQCLGANHPQLIAVYVQRAFYVCLCVSIIASIIQYYGGEIMCAIGEPKEFCPVISQYCRALIPFIYGCVWLTICQRIGQALNMNTYLFYSVLIPAILSLPLNYLFVFYLNFGYIGTAIVIDITAFISFFLTFGCLIYKGYLWIFIPLPFKQVFKYDGIKEYILLALPGLAQSSFLWLISEMLIIISGFIANPSIVVASTVVCQSLNTFLIMTSMGMSNAINIRLGKYIGSGMIFGAKMVAKCAIFINIITVTCFGLVLYFGREYITKIWTHDENVIQLSCQLVIIALIPRMVVDNMQISLSGAFRGLGYPTITAIVVFVSHYGFGMPTVFILLFYVNLRAYSNYGAYTIWLGIVFGQLMSAILLFGILRFKINLKKAADQSLMRIKRTIKNGSYGSIQNSNANKNDYDTDHDAIESS